MKKTIERISQSTESLQVRINMNQCSQNFNLEEWIFGPLKDRKYKNILELCAGTGKQSERLVALLENHGQLTLLDASADAANLLQHKFASFSAVNVLCKDMDEYIANSDKKFDLIFVSYGLYYSKLTETELSKKLVSLLSPGGELVVVGPYGGTNKELFDILKGCGVSIPDSVTYCCENFMNNLFLAMGSPIESMEMKVVSNVQRWDSREKLLKYWENSTFYAAPKSAEVSAFFHNYFHGAKEFIITKRIVKMHFKKTNGNI